MALRFHLPFSSSSPAINHPHIPAKSHRFLPFIVNSSASPSPFLQFHHQFPGCKVEFARNTRNTLARIVCSVATTGEIIETSETVKERSVSVVLLAGGKGKRMGGSMPKQYLPLLGQPIALYSFYTFCRMVQVKEIIVVCDPSYREIFKVISEKSLYLPTLRQDNCSQQLLFNDKKADNIWALRKYAKYPKKKEEEEKNWKTCGFPYL